MSVDSILFNYFDCLDAVTGVRNGGVISPPSILRTRSAGWSRGTRQRPRQPFHCVQPKLFAYPGREQRRSKSCGMLDHSRRSGQFVVGQGEVHETRIDALSTAMLREAQVARRSLAERRAIKHRFLCGAGKSGICKVCGNALDRARQIVGKASGYETCSDECRDDATRILASRAQNMQPPEACGGPWCAVRARRDSCPVWWHGE